ncbi:hypothetical protein [Ruminococcus sp.]|uniref:hypothetical protein n=1 Tax=Ruminococcus sp. TaxID=41978 RepID=UPI003890F199
MNEYQIYCNYVNANIKAEQLEVIAATMLRSAQGDEALCQGYLANGWQGDAMNLFRGKCSEVTSQRNRTAQELKRIAQTIRRVAERNYKAEMKALEIARNRTYGGGHGSGGGRHG